MHESAKNKARKFERVPASAGNQKICDFGFEDETGRA